MLQNGKRKMVIPFPEIVYWPKFSLMGLRNCNIMPYTENIYNFSQFKTMFLKAFSNILNLIKGVVKENANKVVLTTIYIYY